MKFFCIFTFFYYFTLLSANAESLNPLSGNQIAIENGKTLFIQRCAKCHGLMANGLDNGFSNTPGLKKFNKGYIVFKDILKNGYIRMPAWGGMGELDNDQMHEMAAYLESIAEEGAKYN